MKQSLSVDNRAQAIQLGFLLVVAIILIGVSIYQASVVPGQTEAIEQDDYQTARGDLIQLGDNVYTSGVTGNPSTAIFQSGTQYTSRFFFQNPSDPRGSVRTQATGSYQVENAVATDDEAADYWDGSLTWQAQTNDIVFSPDYNRVSRDKHYITGSGVAYIDNANKHVIRKQSMVSDTSLTVMAVGDGIDAAGQTVGLTVQPTTSQTREVTFTDNGSPITISIPTELSATVWENKIVASQMVSEGGYVQNVQDTTEGVELILEQDVAYTFVANQVTISESQSGQSPSRPAAAYATAVTETNVSVGVDKQTSLRTEVRSKFNTPVSNEQISVDIVSGSSLVNVVRSSARTDANGQTETVIEGDGQGEATVRVSFDDASSAVEYVDYTVTVGESGSDSSYTVDWDDPSTVTANNGAVTDCTASECTWDPSKSGGDMDLRSVLTPSVTGIEVDFGVSDQSQGTITVQSTTTDTNGEAETVLQNSTRYGSVDVYAASGGSSDVVKIIIDDDALNEVVADFTYTPDPPDTGEVVSFDASSTAPPDGESITQYEWDWTSDGTYDATGETATHTYSSNGDYDVTVRTTASNGEQDTTTKTVSVNDPPSAFFTASPNPVETNEALTVDASGASDSDGSIVQYEWDWTSDGTYDASGTSPTETHTYSTPGSYDITVRVTDDSGSTATYTRTVTVSSPPNVDALTATDASAGPNPRVDADWTVSDPDNGLAKVTLELRNDNTGTIENTETITVSGGSASGSTRLDGTSGNVGDTYTVILTVEDVDSLTASDTDSTPTS